MRDTTRESGFGPGWESRDDRENDGNSTRAQSELMGFILVFGVVVLSLALVGLAGFVGIDNAQDFQRTTNAELGFTALAADIDEVVRAGAPTRSTEIRISNARLAVEDPEPINVTIHTTDGEEITRTVETRPIVYDSGSGTTLTYHSGALIRDDDGSEVLFGEPNFVLSANDGLVLPIVDTSLDGAGTVGGTTHVDVRTRNAGTEPVKMDERDVETVTVNVSTSNPDAWIQYFEDAGYDPTQDSDHGSVEVTMKPDRAYVTVHHVDVELR